MYKFCKNNLILKSFATAALLTVCLPVFASKQSNQIKSVVSAVAQSNKNRSVNSSPNSSVVLDFSVAVGESWDIKDKPNNIVANCINGDFITGFEYNDVTINTVGGSFFSEAVMYFSDSNNGSDGLRLTIGAGDQSSGTKTFNSNTILDLTDNGLDDIESLANGVFLLQFYENVDDAENAIDARYTDGTVTVWGIDLAPTKNCPFISQGTNTDSDLSAEYSTSQTSSYQLNDAIEFDIKVKNNGNAAATNITLDNYISNSINLVQISCDDGTNSTSSIDLLSLPVQNIDVGDTLSCTLSATIVGYGYIQNSLIVNADNDINPTNDESMLIVNGAIRVIPANNFFTLMILAIFVFLIARRKIVKSLT